MSDKPLKKKFEIPHDQKGRQKQLEELQKKQREKKKDKNG